MGEDGLKLLAQARAETGLPIITEVMHVGNVELVCEYADILQIGTRNMQNYDLLHRGRQGPQAGHAQARHVRQDRRVAAGRRVHPARAATTHVMLCERGVRTFETYTRNTLDLSRRPRRARTVATCPSSSTRRRARAGRSMVPAMCKAALAVGADGLLVEVHPHPEKALKDGAQSITIPTFQSLMRELSALAPAFGRSLG